MYGSLDLETPAHSSNVSWSAHLNKVRQVPVQVQLSSLSSPGSLEILFSALQLMW
jgi:hypothetical protein